MFNPSIYLERRMKLSQNIKEGFILLLGNSDVSMNYSSNPYPFVQDSSFLYYCGLDFPNLIFLLNIKDNTSTLYGTEQSVDDIIWEGKHSSLKELAKLSSVNYVKDQNYLLMI